MNRFEKSTAPSANPIGGMRMSLGNEVTIFPNAAPTTNPTARSTTLPFMTNCLNSENIAMVLLLFQFNFYRPTKASPHGNVKPRPAYFAQSNWIDLLETLLLPGLGWGRLPGNDLARFSRD